MKTGVCEGNLDYTLPFLHCEVSASVGDAV